MLWVKMGGTFNPRHFLKSFHRLKSSRILLGLLDNPFRS